MAPIIFAIELTYSLVIIILCLFIYLKTKQFFNLTKHKGIYHFRKTFLYLSIAILTRLILRSIHIFLHLHRHPIHLFMLVLIGYSSTMAIVSLFMSIAWRKIHFHHLELVSNLIALIISLFALLFKEPLIIMLTQAIIIIITALISFKLSKHSKKFSKLFAIYLLMLLFWLISLSPLSQRRFLPIEFVLITYIFSIIIFAIIFYKVQRQLK